MNFELTFFSCLICNSKFDKFNFIKKKLSNKKKERRRDRRAPRNCAIARMTIIFNIPQAQGC